MPPTPENLGRPGFGRAYPCPACNPESEEDTPAVLWRLSRVSEQERQAYRFSTFELDANPGMRAALAACRDWADGSGPPFLVLAGDRGVGKTHLAYATVAGCIARELTTVVYNVPILLHEVRLALDVHDSTALAAFERRLQRYRCLILDDLGALNRSAFADELLYVAIDARYRERLRTLITLDTEPDRLESRIRSRLLDVGLGRVVHCQGDDYRRMHGSRELTP